MSEPNPYAAPKANLYDEPPAELPAGELGLWRDGDHLVAHCEAQTPADRCVATNLASMQLVPWKIVTREGRRAMELPVAPFYIWIHRLQVAIAIAPLVGTIGIAYAWNSWSPPEYAGLGAGIILAIGSAASVCWHLARFTTLRLYRKTIHYYWIEGVHPDYLGALPKWPYERQ